MGEECRVGVNHKDDKTENYGWSCAQMLFRGINYKNLSFMLYIESAPKLASTCSDQHTASRKVAVHVERLSYIQKS